jgi:mannose-6-phosphate isomerase-like protein (cupin superfamily)
MGEQTWAHYEDVSVDESFTYGTRYGISDSFGSENMRFSVIRFEPGEGGPLHFHRTQEEYYVVLDGKLDVRMGEEWVVAEPGTVLYTPPRNQHSPKNNYDEPAVLLSVSAPNIESIRDEITIVEDHE